MDTIVLMFFFRANTNAIWETACILQSLQSGPVRRGVFEPPGGGDGDRRLVSSGEKCELEGAPLVPGKGLLQQH